jgi:transcriptional regulator with XRE-family HTH domain
MSNARTPDPPASAAVCLGAVLRRLRTLQGLTQAELGRLAGYGGAYISAVERAAARPSHELVERCDRALRSGGVLQMLWSLAAAEASPPATAAARPAPVAGAAARPAPVAGADWVGPGRGAFEATEVARRAETSELGPGTLAALEGAVERLRQAAAATPPGALIPTVRARLGDAGRLLAGRPTLGQHRRLLAAAGWLALLLAQLWFDAGDREAAETSRDAAFRLARQADHPELAAWTVEALALWALADGRFSDALELASAGQDLAPPASAAAVQLALDEAQAWTGLGDRAQAEGARRQAALTRAMLPAAS